MLFIIHFSAVPDGIAHGNAQIPRHVKYFNAVERAVFGIDGDEIILCAGNGRFKNNSMITENYKPIFVISMPDGFVKIRCADVQLLSVKGALSTHFCATDAHADADGTAGEIAFAQM